MSDRLLRAAIAPLAVVGAALCFYLLVARYSGAPLECTSSACETVQDSSYSAVLGVPVAALGLGAYLAILATAFSGSEFARTAGAAVALAGVAFGGYLLYVELVLIDAVCEWCVASDTLMTLLAALTLLRLLAPARGAHA
jgi:uncharacterized membrane protein